MNMIEHDMIRYVLRGNESAIDLITNLAYVSQIWDDLYDKDKEISGRDINSVFIWLLSDLPRNRFYNENFAEIQPLIESAITDWMTSNAFEESRENLDLSWCLRDNLASVLIGMAKIIGGMDWAIKVSPIIRVHVHDETLEGYINELNGQRKS